MQRDQIWGLSPGKCVAITAFVLLASFFTIQSRAPDDVLRRIGIAPHISAHAVRLIDSQFVLGKLAWRYPPESIELTSPSLLTAVLVDVSDLSSREVVSIRGEAVKAALSGNLSVLEQLDHWHTANSRTITWDLSWAPRQQKQYVLVVTSDDARQKGQMVGATLRVHYGGRAVNNAPIRH